MAKLSPRKWSPVSPDRKLDWVLIPNLASICSDHLSGASRLSSCTEAPAKSAGTSGVAVFCTFIADSAPEGKMSSGTVRRFGSGLGKRAPSNSVFP